MLKWVWTRVWESARGGCGVRRDASAPALLVRICWGAAGLQDPPVFPLPPLTVGSQSPLPTVVGDLGG